MQAQRNELNFEGQNIYAGIELNPNCTSLALPTPKDSKNRVPIGQKIFFDG